MMMVEEKEEVCRLFAVSAPFRGKISNQPSSQAPTGMLHSSISQVALVQLHICKSDNVHTAPAASRVATSVQTQESRESPRLLLGPGADIGKR